MTGGYIDPIDCIAPKRRKGFQMNDTTQEELPPLPELANAKVPA
jgi:hypothetical protein